MDESSEGPGGLLTAGKRIMRSVCDLARARLELFLVELKEERIRVFDAVLLLLLGVGCTLMTLVLLTFTHMIFCFGTATFVCFVLRRSFFGAALVQSRSVLLGSPRAGADSPDVSLRSCCGCGTLDLAATSPRLERICRNP